MEERRVGCIAPISRKMLKDKEGEGGGSILTRHGKKISLREKRDII